MDTCFDYAQIYKTLDGGAKKGFFRKHASGDSADDFACIAKSLSGQECHDLAASFLLGKAKCEFTANNHLAEAATLFTAARHFIQAEDKLDCLNAVSYGENLDNATMCLLRAAKMYEINELHTMAANCYTYLVDTLMRHHRWGESITYLKRALEILSRDLMSSLQLLRRLTDCQLNLCDWPGALNTCIRLQSLLLDPMFSTSVDVSWQLYVAYWKTAEVFRVLLILLTAPPEKLSNRPGVGYSLAAYVLGETNNANDDVLPDTSFGTDLQKPPSLDDVDEELFVYLQSFVLAYRSRDVVEVESASATLQAYLDNSQRSLLLTLTNQLVDVTSIE